MSWRVEGPFPDELFEARAAVSERLRLITNEAVRNLCAADAELAFEALGRAVSNGGQGRFTLEGARSAAGLGHVGVTLIFEK